jgi:hypothetical protein
MLAVAFAVGTVGQIAAYLIWRKHIPRTQASPLIAAIVGVAWSSRAIRATSIEIATLAVILELCARATYQRSGRRPACSRSPQSRSSHGRAVRIHQPGEWQTVWRPIIVGVHVLSRAWVPIDPIRLYGVHVPVPVFATSLLAVAVGAAWFAYARRVSLVVLITFFLGALVPIYAFHWDYLFQLDSGPMWFVAALLLSDRRLLPGSWAIRPVLGFGAGLLSVGLRRSGYGIEASFFTVAGVQAVMAFFVLVFWAGTIASGRWKRNRRLREREAHLRVVKSVSRAG